MINLTTPSYITNGQTILVGFSGGPDSVFLLLYLKQLQTTHKLNLIALHLDHEWRAESKDEAEWCKQFCKQQNITFISKKASEITLDQKFNGSKEEYARKLRRTFFQHEATKYPRSLIALGHHQDDQIETFFIRLARGTSLVGLTGIKEVDDLYVRPLLSITKQEILDYLEKNHLTFLQDPSNQDPSFLRNRIRNQLTPILPDIDPRLQKNFISTMHHLTQVDAFLREQTQQSMDAIANPNQKNSLNIKQFLQLNPLIQQRILLYLLINQDAQFTPSQALFAEIIRFLTTGKQAEHSMHPSYKVIKTKEFFSIKKR